MRIIGFPVLVMATSWTPRRWTVEALEVRWAADNAFTRPAPERMDTGEAIVEL